MAAFSPAALRGIYAVLPTPFRADMAVDYGALENIVDYCAACKVRGIVTPANASEQPMLMDAERRKIVEVTVKKAAGRMPVIAGITAPNAFAADTYARWACDAGADALLAMPPYVVKAAPPAIAGYYLAAESASHIPIILQNYGGPLGTPLSPRLMLDICAGSERTFYIKEESSFSSQRITQTLEMAKLRPDNKLRGILGGKAGRYIIEEFRRGAVGNMPACEIADIHVTIWNHCERSEFAAAQKLLDLALPLLNFEAVYGSCAYKEVLRRRGVIPAAYARSVAEPRLDRHDMRELDRILESIAPAFEV